MTEADLQAIEAELAATTQGEWRAIPPGSADIEDRYPGDRLAPGSEDCGGIVAGGSVVCRFGDSEQYYPTAGVCFDPPDHEFVCNAHNRHVPALLAEVRRLTALLSREQDISIDHAMQWNRDLNDLRDERDSLAEKVAELADAAKDAVITFESGGMPGGPIMRLRAALAKTSEL